MFTIPVGHFLTLPGLQTLVKNFKASLTKALDDIHVRYSVDTAASQLVIDAVDITALGDLGDFDGQFRWPYQKASLDVVLPYPLLCELPYPTTYRQVVGLLQDRYHLLLEEGDVALTPSGNGLMLNDPIAVALHPDTGTLSLYATANSVRFQAGTVMRLTIAPPLGPIRLNMLIASAEPLTFSSLTDVS